MPETTLTSPNAAQKFKEKVVAQIYFSSNAMRNMARDLELRRNTEAIALLLRQHADDLEQSTK